MFSDLRPNHYGMEQLIKDIEAGRQQESSLSSFARKRLAYYRQLMNDQNSERPPLRKALMSRQQRAQYVREHGAEAYEKLPY